MGILPTFMLEYGTLCIYLFLYHNNYSLFILCSVPLRLRNDACHDAGNITFPLKYQ